MRTVQTQIFAAGLQVAVHQSIWDQRLYCADRSVVEMSNRFGLLTDRYGVRDGRSGEGGQGLIVSHPIGPAVALAY